MGPEDQEHPEDADGHRDCRQEIARLEAWVRDLQDGMIVNCVYCGHQYGRKDAVPMAIADVLKAHIEACPDHPMSALKRRNAVLERQWREMKEAYDSASENARWHSEKNAEAQDALIQAEARIRTAAQEAVQQYREGLIPEDARVREAMEWADEKCFCTCPETCKLRKVLAQALLRARAELKAERERAAKVVEAAKSVSPSGHGVGDLRAAIAVYDKEAR